MTNLAVVDDSSTEVRIGLRDDNQVETWNLSRRPNFNSLFLGSSGSGKTFRLQHAIAPLVLAGMSFHILDVKDDFGYDSFAKVGLGSTLGPEHFNDIDLSYVDGDAGINILQFSRMSAGGGVYMAIQEFIEIAKYFNPQLSQKMAGYINDLLVDLYKSKNIVHEDQSTWVNEPPNVADLLDHIDKIISMMKSGLRDSVLDELYKVRKKARKAKREQEDETFNECVDLANKLLCKYGHEVCTDKSTFYSQWNVSTLGSIRDTVKAMVGCGLFTKRNPVRKRGVINRYRIASLHPVHQQVIFRVVLSQVYSMSVMETMMRGSFNPDVPSHIVVCDEGKHAKQIATSDMSPLNRIATEGRGYGCGMMIGVQRMKHVTDDMASNFGSRFILKTDEISYPLIKKAFNIPSRRMNELKAQQNVLFYTEDTKFNLVT